MLVLFNAWAFLSINRFFCTPAKSFPYVEEENILRTEVCTLGTLNTTLEIENVNVNVEFFLHTLIFPHFGSASTCAKHF